MIAILCVPSRTIPKLILKISLMLQHFGVRLGLGLMMSGNKPLAESVLAESNIPYDLDH